jgi:putative nucleotidyltransferase with HDIG domain
MADVILISDNLDKSADIGAGLSTSFWVDTLIVGTDSKKLDTAGCVMLIDCDLGTRATVEGLRAILAGTIDPERTIFLNDGKDFKGQVRSNALGGEIVMDRAGDTKILAAEIDRILNTIRPDGSANSPEAVRNALNQAKRLHQEIAVAVSKGEPLPKDAVEDIGHGVGEAVGAHGIDVWIDAVRHYHSHTYRHCMAVTGYAVAFGQRMDLNTEDIDLLSIAGLLHDVGKVRIPLSVLDKPAKLTEEEFEQIKRHPMYSREILTKDAQFSGVIIDAAAQHHEYVDGSGYPDGLIGDQISPLVRILTIADIFAALTEERSYKPAFDKRKAFQILTEMGDKLDTRLLAAFRPVVINEAFGRIRKPVQSNAASKPSVLNTAIHPLDTPQTTAA